MPHATSFSFKSYLKTFVIISVFALLFSAITIIIVDPKGIFWFVRIDGFNMYKAYQRFYTDEVKALALRRYHPDTVVFGASPITFGLVPDCRNSQQVPSRIYNYGGAGAQMLALNANYLDMRAVGSIRRIAFETRLPSNRFVHADGTPISIRNLEAPREATHFWGWAVRQWIPANYAGAYLANLFSLHEVILSLQTIAANRQRDRSELFYGFEPNGAYDQTWFRRFAASVISDKGLRDHIINYRNLLLTKVSNNMEVDYSYFDVLAARAGRDGIALDVFVTPEHVSELLLYSEGNIWPLYEKFKKGLLRAAISARSHYGVDVRVFDFGTVNDASLQPVRAVDDKKRPDPYFADPVHYRKQVGDFILATMYGCQSDQPAPVGFGIELNAENIDAHLANERAKLELVRRTEPELVAKVVSALQTRE